MRSGRAIPGRRDAEAGVSLVEILVVLAILGITAGIVGLSLPSERGTRGLRAEADLLAARLNIAVEESLVTGRPAALDWGEGGYSFEERHGPDWQPHRNPRLAEAHRFDGGLGLRAGSAGLTGRIDLDPEALPPPGGGTELRLAGGRSTVTVRFDGLTARVEDRP